MSLLKRLHLPMSVNARLAEIEKLSHRRPASHAVGPLAEFLDDADPNVRCATVRAFGQLRTAQALDKLTDVLILRRLLDDENAYVREALACTVGAIGEACDQRRVQAIEILARLLNDERQSVGVIAAEQLAKLPHISAIEAIANKREKCCSWPLNDAIVTALGLIGGCAPDLALRVLLEYSLGEAAISAIIRLNNPDAVPTLIRLCVRDYQLSESARKALDIIDPAWANSPQADGCVPDLVSVFTETSDHRVSSLICLHFGGCFKGSVRAVQLGSCDLLSCIPSARAQIDIIQTLIDRLSSRRADDVCWTAGALGKFGNRRALEALLEFGDPPASTYVEAETRYEDKDSGDGYGDPYTIWVDYTPKVTLALHNAIFTILERVIPTETTQDIVNIVALMPPRVTLWAITRPTTSELMWRAFEHSLITEPASAVKFLNSASDIPPSWSEPLSEVLENSLRVAPEAALRFFELLPLPLSTKAIKLLVDRAMRTAAADVQWITRLDQRIEKLISTRPNLQNEGLREARKPINAAIERNRISELEQSLKSVVLNIECRCSTGDQLYGSVTASTI